MRRGGIPRRGTDKYRRRRVAGARMAVSSQPCSEISHLDDGFSEEQFPPWPKGGVSAKEFRIRKRAGAVVGRE